MDPPQIDRSDKNRASDNNHSSPDYAPYPNLDPKEGTFVKGSLPSEPSATAAMPSSSPPDSVVRNAQFPMESAHATTFPQESNPYVSPSSAPPKKDPMVTVRDVLSKWGKRVGEAVKEAEDLAGNVWQHLKTGPSVADAAMGRIAQGTKVLAEGGYEKIFRHTFDTLPEEELQKSYACYLSTSAGPIMGILYLSTAKLAFCSDNPLPYKAREQTEWSYYKVVIPLHQLKAVNPSVNNTNPAEKYIQIISVDNHEFWFMGFVTYDNAVTHLREALGQRGVQVV